MRNLSAEKSFADKLFLWAGSSAMLGLLLLAIGAEIWIINNFFSNDLPLFLILQGSWFFLIGVILSTLANVIHRNLKNG